MIKKIGLWIVPILLIGATNVKAIDFGNRLSFGGGLGRVYPIGNSNFKNTHDDGQAWTVDAKYGLGDEVTFITSYANLKTENELTGDDLTLQPIMGSFRYHPFNEWRVSPYFIAGAGVSINKREFNNNAPDKKWEKFGYQGGVGVELFGNQGASFGVQGLYHHFDGANNEADLRLASVMGTINIYFGEEQRTRMARAEATKVKSEKSAALEELERSKKEAAQIRADAKADADRMKAEAEALMAKTQTAQDAATKYKKEASAAEKAAREAQAEIDEIKKMIAKKDIAPVTFKYASAILQETSYETLDLVVASSKKYPNLSLQVEGHTDSVGDDASNLKLSQKRAESVRQYLIGKGVPAKNVKAIGLGETHPIASNKTKEGRALNRRVEFVYTIQ